VSTVFRNAEKFGFSREELLVWGKLVRVQWTMRNMLPTSAATELPNIVQQLQEHVLALSNENNVLTTRLGTLQTTTGDILTILRAMQTDVKTITTSVEVSIVGDTPKRKKSTHYHVSQPSSQESVLESTSLEEEALVSQSRKGELDIVYA
jgi:hypothetical protein